MRPLFVFLSYLALTLVMTWPLAAGIASDVPGDLGDSLLNMWILGWGAEMFPRLLIGEASLRDVWNANIFHPEPLALGFSEHLFGQVLQILPVYYLTGNLILCYNLLFISTFALSGLAMFLLVREMTGNSTIAFFAGLIYAFVPFRVAQVAHIQTLSSQWMPLALYGLRRFVHATDRRWVPLAGGSFALVMQNWSCGYYVLFFPPFLVLFLVHQIWTAGRLRDRITWLGLIGAAFGVVAATTPFLMLYLETQRVHAFERPFVEIVRFSADVYAYFTAPEMLRVWSGLRVITKPENEVFLGLVPMIVATYAVYGLTRDAWHSTASSPKPAGARLVMAIILLLLGAAIFAGLITIIFTGGVIASIWGIRVRASNVSRLIIELIVIVGFLLLLVPRARRFAAQWIRSTVGLGFVGAFLAWWLSLGPAPTSNGRPLADLGLYNVLYSYVPGFDGLRAPARLAMIVSIFLALLAAYGAMRIEKWRRGRQVVIALCVLFLIEAVAIPFPVNLTWGDSRLPPVVYSAPNAPPVYHAIASLPESAVIAELPLGDPGWELRYVYYSTVHWRPLLNGYSGGYPDGYASRSARIYRLPRFQEDAWQALREGGTTHVVVHRAALPPDDANAIEQWLAREGAREIGRFETDVLYEMPAMPRG